MKQSEEMKRINEEFKKSPAYAEMMKYAWIEKDVNGQDMICLPEDCETNYEEYKKQKEGQTK